MSQIEVTTTFGFEGYRIREYRGVVRGITVRTPNVGQGCLVGFLSIFGGEMGPLTDVCEAARGEALQRMLQHAREAGANAVVGLRYDASACGQAASTEVLCYGTAVVIEPL
jgi:uncharacterized protein YbjQ (UPF0145 family)